MKKIYLLDTNVISEIFKQNPNKNVLNHLFEKEKLCCMAATTWNELLYGINILPEGNRKNFLFSKLIEDVQTAFPIIQFDDHAALIQADIRARLKSKGIVVDYTDTEIASIAVSNQLILVTRNVNHYESIREVDSVFYYENWFEE